MSPKVTRVSGSQNCSKSVMLSSVINIDINMFLLFIYLFKKNSYFP